MMSGSKFINRRTVVNILGSLFIGVLLAWVMNEITFQFLRNDASRAPEKIELVIPKGTGEKIAQGSVEPTIPEGMVFVIGDVLTVINQDGINHQLGPLYIPAGTSASLTFDIADKYSYSCSFVPDKTFGLDVQLPVTPMTRLTGAIFAGLPLGALIALYSFVIGSTGTVRKKNVHSIDVQP